MRTQGIYINVSRRNDDLPEMIEDYSEKFNLSKADTVAEILREYPKLIAYKQKVMDMVRLSLSNGGTLDKVAESMDNTQKAAKQIAGGQREELVNT